MADVVAFELEARAMGLAQPLDDAGNVLERVAEDMIVGAVEIRLLPVVLQSFTRSPARAMLKFMLPMFRLHISGLASSGAASRSSSVMFSPPPVVMFTTASSSARSPAGSA